MNIYFKRILSELSFHKKRVAVVAIFGILMGLAQARVFMLLNTLMNDIQKNQDLLRDATANGFLNQAFFSSSLFQTSALILGVVLLAGVSRYIHLFNMNYLAEMVVIQLRRNLQEKFMNLSISFHNSYASGSGGLISRVLNDMSVIQNGLRMVADFFREPVMLVALLGNLFYLDFHLTIFIFVMLPLILGFLKTISKTIKTTSIQSQQDLETMTSTIKESLDGVRVIQSFNLQQHMKDRFLRECRIFLEARRKLHSRVELAGPVTEFIFSIVFLGILFYISHRIAIGQATIGTAISYVGSLLALGPPIKKIQESYVRIQETLTAAERVYTLMDEVSVIPQSGKESFPIDWHSIQYKNVSFGYHQEKVLKNIDLTIQRGEMIAFVGASGSGKSTLVNLLERFFDPTSGQISIDGIPLNDIHILDLRKNIALVTQDVFLFSDSIENNIWSGDLTKSKDLIPLAAKTANADSFIERTPHGYKTLVGERGGLLSGGEKQRISIARAVLKDASILILDEATSALDSGSEIEVQKGLDHLMSGRTSLVIAHRLSTIRHAHRIVVMKNGEIVETGKHQELLALGGEYAQLYKMQYQHQDQGLAHT